MMLKALTVAGLLLYEQDGLEDARRLIRRGLLARAEGQLTAYMDGGAMGESLSRALLLLGNIDYERGDYDRAAERYEAAWAGATGPASVVEAARENHLMAERRLTQLQRVATSATKLRWAVALAVACVAGLIAWQARQSRPAG
jgi:hypothetical protein